MNIAPSPNPAFQSVTTHDQSSTSPNVLFITRKWAPAMGGMETWSHKLAEHLGKMAKVDTIALPGETDGSQPRKARLLKFPFTVLKNWSERKHPPDAVIIGDMASWPLALPALMSRHTAHIVLAAHGTDVSYPRRRGVRGRLYGLYQRLGAHILRDAAVVANSRATADCAQLLGWQNISVQPLASEASAIEPRADHNGRVLFAGRLIPMKGCGWFVDEVLPLLPESIGLDIAGSGWGNFQSGHMTGKRVRYLGKLEWDKLDQAYGEAMCVVLPNIDPGTGEFEGFGLVAVEAANAGGVVLAADSGGLPDAIVEGETGTLIPSGDERAWADAITKIAEMPPQDHFRIRKHAQLTARSTFSWTRVAQKFAELCGAHK